MKQLLALKREKPFVGSVVKSLRITLALIMMVVGHSASTWAQISAQERRADRHFETFSYPEAIEYYLRVDALSTQGQRRLAESYKKTNQFVEAERIYEAFIQSEDATSEDLYNYASVLRANGKYAESNLWLEQFHRMEPDDLRGKSFINHIDDFPDMIQDQRQYRIRNLDINTPYQEFGTAYYYNDQIVFASTRKTIRLIRRYYSWNEQPFLDLHIADFDGRQLRNPRPFYGKSQNNKWHEGPASFARNGNLMAFTRSNMQSTSEDGTHNLEIYFSEKDNAGEWGNPIPFRLNSPEYSVGHPFLTQDGNTMYFSSDMPGGFGGADIYRIQRNRNGNWGQPENLGEAINTEGDEFFPFFHENEKVLFFSSNGHLGLGGLDIFLSPQLGNNNFSYVMNAGARLNSRFDDFALIMDEEMKTGFFSSNRVGGKGDDDLYFFELLKPYTFGKVISGIAKDNSGNILQGAQISLYDTEGEFVQSIVTPESGIFEFVLDSEQDWILKGEKKGYFEQSKTVTTMISQDIVSEDLVLHKNPELALYFSVVDKKSRRPVENVHIELKNNLTDEEMVVRTSSSGTYTLPLAENRMGDQISYDIIVEGEGFLRIADTYNRVLDKEGRYDVFDELGVIFFKIEPGKTRLEELLNIRRIEFDSYRHNLRSETITELEKVVNILNENPSMAIEVGSHTDCRGSTQLNQQLSERRAQSMAEYIRERISNPSRVTFKGYGRTVLLNECDCFLIPPQFCTEEQHAENRRAEFIIMRM